MIDKIDSSANPIISEEEIEKIKESLKKDFESYLKKYDVKFPSDNSNKYLHLIFLYKYKGKLVHKDLISDFVSSQKAKAGKDQQVRHLAADGWYILNKGESIPGTDEIVPNGYHLLYDTKIPKPSFMDKKLKRLGRLGATNFEQLKIVYNNQCATCGAIDGKPHPHFPDKIVKLQQGHMNPNKPLTLDNTIPQCQICNQTLKDYFIFDNNGYPKAINNPEYVLRSEEKTKNNMIEILLQDKKDKHY